MQPPYGCGRRRDYDYHALSDADRRADAAIGEKPGEISIRAMNREYEQRHPQRQTDTHKRKHNFEMSL